MLTLTDSARDVVRKIPHQPLLPSTAGLRICRRTGVAADGPLDVAAVHEPEPTDQVVDSDGARVFLGEQAAVALDGLVLDAGTDDRGRIQFSVVGPREAVPTGR